MERIKSSNPDYFTDILVATSLKAVKNLPKKKSGSKYFIKFRPTEIDSPQEFKLSRKRRGEYVTSSQFRFRRSLRRGKYTKLKSSDGRSLDVLIEIYVDSKDGGHEIVGKSVLRTAHLIDEMICSERHWMDEQIDFGGNIIASFSLSMKVIGPNNFICTDSNESRRSISDRSEEPKGDLDIRFKDPTERDIILVPSKTEDNEELDRSRKNDDQRIMRSQIHAGRKMRPPPKTLSEITQNTALSHMIEIPVGAVRYAPAGTSQETSEEGNDQRKSNAMSSEKVQDPLHTNHRLVSSSTHLSLIHI